MAVVLPSTLSLHDALPILVRLARAKLLPTQSLPTPSPKRVSPAVFTASARGVASNESSVSLKWMAPLEVLVSTVSNCSRDTTSEEQTPELQTHRELVCRPM